jgi:putative transposase
MQYRRSQAAGATFFFTVVTYDRKRYLCSDENPTRLKQSMESVKAGHPFTIDAIVLLPDHLHCIWTLPQGDNNYSTRWMLIKSTFTRICSESVREIPSPSRIHKREQGVWQRRYWEHQIRDEQDYIRHVEYIHYNPVKHGLAKSPMEWKYSSFHRFVKNGTYHADWGAKERIVFDGAIGRE